MPVPNTFANATATIPLSQLDANFATTITLGNTAIQLGNTVTTLNNMTLANVTISSGNVTITNVTVTTANVTTANIGTSIITTSETLNYGTANQVQYLNASKVLTGSANLTFDGTTLTPHTLTVSTGVLTVPAGSNTAPSITTSGDTNTGIFYPAADTVAIGTGGTERLRVDSAGNAGLGVTPSAWGSGTRAFQVGSGAALYDFGSSNVAFGSNVYFDGTNNRYINTDFATYYQQNNGAHVWANAASGTAGNAITFTQAMTLYASGNLSLGNTTDNTRLHVTGLNQTNGTAQFTANSAKGTNDSYVHYGTNGDWYIRSASASGNVNIQDTGGNVGIGTSSPATMLVVAGTVSITGGTLNGSLGSPQLYRPATDTLAIATGATERARITSDGAFCINTNAGTSGSSLAITGSGSTGATYNVYTRNSASNVVFATENGGVIYTGTLGGSPYNNTTASAANMFVTSGGVLQRSTSSGRFKTEVEDLEVGRADAILNLRPVWYRSTCQSDNPNWSWYGLIAEDVAQVEPRLVHWGYDSDDLETVEVEIEVEKERTVKDDDGNETVEAYTETVLKPIQQPKEGAQLRPDGVQYDRMTVLLLDIVKRQQSRLEALEAEVQALKGNA